MAIFQNFPQKEPLASNNRDGLMSKEDKVKIDSMKIPTNISELVNDVNYLKDTEVESVVNEAIKEIDIDSAVNNALKDMDIDSKVNEAVKDIDITGTVNEAIKDIDISSQINDALKDIDIGPAVDEAIKEFDIESSVNTAINNAIENGDFDSKTAYEYAQEAGYTGTEEDFAKKLATSEFASAQFDNTKRLLRFLDTDGNTIGEPVYIEGGGGGSSSSIKLIDNTGTSNITKPKGENVELSFTVLALEDGASTGNISCKINVGGLDKTTLSIPQGDNTIEISKYLKSGTNDVIITCSDVYGNSKSLYYTISVIELSISSTFDDTINYTGDVQFKYTVYGAIEKTVYIVLDGDEDYYVETTTSSGKQTTVTITDLTHGVHTIEAYVIAELDGTPIESNRLKYDMMYIESDNDEILIASVFETKEVSQGTMLSIPYNVLDPSTLNANVSLIISNEDGVYSTQELTVDRTRQYWKTRSYPVGTTTFTIKCGEKEKSHTLTVTEMAIDVEPVTNDLELYLSSTGRSNNEADPAHWEYNGITTTFENVNWDSTGWVPDENGDTVLRLNGGATAEINFKPFETDWKTYGKTIELEYTIQDVNTRDAVVISCMDGNIGLTVTADTARLSSEQEVIETKYSDGKKRRISFTVQSKGEYRLMELYIDGYRSQVKRYTTSDNFQQNTPMNIKIGSEYCGIDLYIIRSYSTALTQHEILDNYIYDMADIDKKMIVWEANNVYNDYNQIDYGKIKTKIPVKIFTGKLPQSKGDKQNFSVVFEHNTLPELNYTDSGKLDVQGTSSQWYIRKNYKEKLEEDHLLDTNQILTNVFCDKADYAESTGTHNTQTANFVETLYSEKTPAQLVDPRCRTTIYGYPGVIFHKETEDSEPEFIGKYNFNFDKGSEAVFGFDGSFDVECWEFGNNTSGPCNFTENVTEENWADSFEARYPDGYEDISRFKIMHDWVVSTKDDIDKFVNEFEDHFNLHYMLIYYIATSILLAADQRAKNLFLTYWADTGKWEPWFYDNDTILGINNEGDLAYDYYHEDIDTIGNANVYNGQNSVLWENFRIGFADKIQETYQQLRSAGKISAEVLLKHYIEDGASKWSQSIYNEDGWYKYISMLVSDDDETNLYQVRGTGEAHLDYFAPNRIKYYDSKWLVPSFMNDYVVLRIYTPAEYAGIRPNANITVTPFSHMYAAVKYKANGTLQQIRAEAGEETLFEAPNETFNDTETAIFGASELSSIGDLAPLYCGTINVSAAKRLVDLKIGDSTKGYVNTNLNDLSIGTNRLLRRINVCNCPNLVKPLALKGCPNIEEIYATGSGITSIELPDSGYLKIVQLPATITNLTLKNQLYITDFSLEGYTNITTLNIENCPSIDVLDLISKCPNLNRIRLAKIDWRFSDASKVLELARGVYKGIDENGNNVDYANVSGKCYIESLTGAELSEISEAFPYLEISYTNLTSYLIFMNGDYETEIYRQAIINAADGTDPVKEGNLAVPTKESTAQYSYTYANGWSTKKDATEIDNNALKHVEGDRYVYPVFVSTIRKYTVYFYNGDKLEEVVTNVPYGSSATFSGDISTFIKPNIINPEDFICIGWRPSPEVITGETKCMAYYKYTGIMTYRLLDKELIGGADNDRIDTLGDYAMYNMQELTSVEFPNVTSIGDFTFGKCKMLERATLPLLDTIGDYAFADCINLTDVEFDSILHIGNYVFQNCNLLTDATVETAEYVGSGAFYGSSITSITLPNVLSIYPETFYTCYNLKLVNLPLVEYVANNAFYYCHGLEHIELPSAKILDNGAFFICTKLSSISIPLVTSIGHNTFYNCDLREIELPKVNIISKGAFDTNKLLTSVTLRSNTICTLENSDAFANTPISEGNGYIYVPAVLYNGYRNATNWSIYADQILPYDSCIEYMEDVVSLYNNTTSVNVELIGYDEPPTIDISTNNNGLTTISNINTTNDLLSFDITASDFSGAATITVKATGTDGSEFTRDFKIYVVNKLSTYTVEPVEGSEYGFTLNERGYYESENIGVSGSYALCKIDISNSADCNVLIDCISSGESKYDYGILSEVDKTLTLSNIADTQNVFKSFKDQASDKVQTIEYGAVSGTVYAKFIKDSSGNAGYDSFQFRIRFDYSGGE